MGSFFSLFSGNDQNNNTLTNDEVKVNDVVNRNDADVDMKLFEWTKDKNITQSLDFEKWYPIVSDYTMKSVIIDCTKEEINAIKKGCDIHRDDVISDIDINERKLEPQIENILNKFGNKIQKYIDDNNLNNNGIFIRFSHRSPKDAVLKINQNKFNKIVEINSFKIYKLQKTIEMFDKYNFNLNQQITNCIMRGMTQAWSTTLCIKNGIDAIKLIINSERIFTDFLMGELMNGTNFNTKLILREFNHNIDFEYEFRCFIFKNNLNCITQYNHFIYLRKLIDNKENIKNLIHLFWKNKIHPNMIKYNITSYVMDIALLKNVNNNKLILIEINPFITKAGALLFDWKKDVEIITSANSKDIEFRILEKPYNSQPPKLNSYLTDLYDTLFQKIKNTQLLNDNQ